MNVKVADIRPILGVADICDLLRLSESQFYTLKQEGFFAAHGLLVPIQPDIDRKVRYSGEPFVQWLSDKNQLRLLRQTMRAIEASGLARASGG